MSKISKLIKNYVLQKKRNNLNLTVRKLAEESSKKFNTNISKSTINSLIRKAGLSSPVGRSVKQDYRPSGEVEYGGVLFLLAANLRLGFSKILAAVVKKFLPAVHLKQDTLEAVYEAWIIARALYNVSLDKIENYDKSELWFLTGRKVSRGVMTRCMALLKNMQPIVQYIVNEIHSVLQDVQYFTFYLADGAQYSLDGRLKSIWREANIPIDFSSTINTANSYINSIIHSQKPLVLFNAFPERLLSEELSDFIFSFDGSLPQKRIRRVELVSPQGVKLQEIPYVLPEKRSFILGLWPWQYKRITEIENQAPDGKFFVEATQEEIYYIQDAIKFAQHVYKKQVMIRLVVLKRAKDDPALLGLFTNVDEEELSAREIACIYLRHWPDPVGSHRIFLNAVKTPAYADDFISSEKLLKPLKKLLDNPDPETLFSVLVEIMDAFVRREFFPPECFSWSALKMRDLVYRQQGVLRRDMANDVFFNLLINKDLKKILEEASVKFNENLFLDATGRRLTWSFPAA